MTNTAYNTNVMLPLPHLSEQQIRGMSVFTDDALYATCSVRIAFIGRTGGVSVPPYDSLNVGMHVPDDPAAVCENRERIMNALCRSLQGGSLHGGSLQGQSEVEAQSEEVSSQAAICTQPETAPCAQPFVRVIPKQVHGTRILSVSSIDQARKAGEDITEADAVVVSCSHVVAQLSFADCLPLIIVAPSGGFAVVHAGWRGALAGIPEHSAQTLAQHTQDDPAHFNVYIGPYIHEECFDTDTDVKNAFVSEYGKAVLGDHGNINLATAVTTSLQRAGIDAARIADIASCTVCNPPTWFSYRASQGKCGRHAACAVREE